MDRELMTTMVTEVEGLVLGVVEAEEQFLVRDGAYEAVWATIGEVSEEANLVVVSLAVEGEARVLYGVEVPETEGNTVEEVAKRKAHGVTYLCDLVLKSILTLRMSSLWPTAKSAQ